MVPTDMTVGLSDGLTGNVSDAPQSSVGQTPQLYIKTPPVNPVIYYINIAARLGERRGGHIGQIMVQIGWGVYFVFL